MSGTTTLYIILWLILLLIAVYGGLTYKYYYRVVDNVMIMQCTEKTFHRDLLDERQPLLCSGFDNTNVFLILKNHSQSTPLSEDITNDMYSRLNTISPWFCYPQPIQYHHLHPTTKQQDYVQCNASVYMHIQLSGMTKVSIVHPKHMSDTPQYTELIVPKGYVLFIPFQWWVNTVTMDEKSVHAVLMWKSIFE